MSRSGSANHDAITMQQRTKEPEENLWTAVLTRAVQDIFSTNDERAAQAAISWFKSKSRDFRNVCDLAGRNPQYVYTKIMPKIQDREKYMGKLKERRPYAQGASSLILRKVNIDGQEYDSNHLSNM
mgnify:CR=1 FL=1